MDVTYDQVIAFLGGFLGGAVLMVNVVVRRPHWFHLQPKD